MRKRPNDVEKLDRISDTMDADKQGNVEVGKDFKIGGNLHFSSLVSEKNPEGIFDPSSGGTGGGGGGKLYRHNISFLKPNISIYFDVYSTIPQNFTFPEFYIAIKNNIACTGTIKVNDIKGYPVQIIHKNNEYQINYVDSNGEKHVTTTNEGSVSLIDVVTPVE